ncbi:hypothetical protein [Acetobacter persici]|uniref:hypothetical protein n=1 Tax=Acetobacter persici TaxID=1076596 RepID=UPI001F2746C3|nr:hypothetical protein [Acetobacter persici]MCG0998154.1 hypothetical protein [Acetobacter persici]
MSEELKALTFPEVMTEDIEQALGLMCFQCGQYAHAFKKGGENIPPKAEKEQAAIIFKVLKNVLSGMPFDAAFTKMHNDAVRAQESGNTRAGEKA